MKINYDLLIKTLEKKSNKAIERLDQLKCYTTEFQETLKSILGMLEASKEIEKYDTECLDCKKEDKKTQEETKTEEQENLNNTESQIGKPYKTFKEEDYE